MIFYIHGFNSSGQSKKGQFIKEKFPEAHFFTPSYPNDLTKAIPFLDNYISHKIRSYDHLDKVMLIGSSLGGFFSLYLGKKYGTKVCLINPALDPVKTLSKYLGENTNYYSGEKYILSENQIDFLKKYYLDEIPEILLLVLLDENDEILDSHHTCHRFKGLADIKLFPGGSHQFDHLPESVPFIRSLYFSK